MRRDLLRSIVEEKDVTNVIVLTHNIDFVFVQTVVLSTVRRCGHPSVTIFADAACAAGSFAQQASVLHELGVRYRVVPVEMAPGFRFHPKALLLSGPRSATLYVGSGNLTFGGWRENAEVWARFDAATDGTQPFAAFLRYLSRVLEVVALPEAVRAEIEEAFDAKTHAWATELGEIGGLIWRAGQGPSLLDQMLAHIGGAPAERVWVCAPYFDKDAEALSAIIERSGGAPVVVVVQPGRTGLTEAAWLRVSGSVQAVAVTFQRSDEHDRVREAFVHAKFYAFERAGRVTVFAGSANCSRAALTIPGKAGNAELMAVQEMSVEEFRTSFVEELVPKDGSLGLASQPPNVSAETIAELRILGASYEGGHLRIAYAPRDRRVTACVVDGTRMQFDRIGPGLVGIRLERAPRHVFLEASDGRTTVQSGTGWVDHEWELRSTARGRGVADAIRSRVRAGQWGVGAWAEVLEAFCAHLRYLPQRLTARGGVGSSQQRDGGRIEYSVTDTFATGYGLPSLSAFMPPLASAEERVRSLQELLLRWFGLPVTHTESGRDGGSSQEPADEDEDMVDRPEELPTSIVQARTTEPTERERRRVERVLDQMAEAMTSGEFLHERPPDLLGADVKVASALLRVALRERWIDSDAFFQTTHRIWLPLFFDGEGDGRGWLQRRYESAVVQDDFVSAIRSPGLVAALVAWAVAVQRELPTAAHSRFALASALAIARLPWLWDGLDDESVCRELAALLAYTTPSSASGATEGVDAVSVAWLQLLQRGHALRCLELSLVGWTPARLAPHIRQSHLAKGEVLWQGTSDFCVVVNAASRMPGPSVDVLPLRQNRPVGKHGQEGGAKRKKGAGAPKDGPQAASGVKRFDPTLTVPLAALLEAPVIPLTEGFGVGPREVLRGFVAELAKGFAAGEP